MPEQSDVQVEDGDNFRVGEALGIKGIALEQYRRCCVEGSKEMKKGGTTTKFIGGIETQIDIPNQREIFINSVKMLSAILSPEVNMPDQEEIMEELIKIDEQIKYEEEHCKKVLDEEKEKYIGYKINKPDAYKKVIGIAKDSLDTMRERNLVVFYQNKLIILSKSLKALNYFDESGSTVGG